MKFEGKHFCLDDLIQDIIKMALAATKEKEIIVTYEIVADIAKMVSYVYMIPLLFTQEKKLNTSISFLILLITTYKCIAV